MGDAAELSPGRVLDDRLGEDLRGHAAGQHSQGLPSLADQLPVSQGTGDDGGMRGGGGSSQATCCPLVKYGIDSRGCGGGGTVYLSSKADGVMGHHLSFYCQGFFFFFCWLFVFGLLLLLLFFFWGGLKRGGVSRMRNDKGT